MLIGPRIPVLTGNPTSRLTPEQFAQIVNNVGEGPITLNCRPSPSFSDYHQAPRRQYVVNLSGVAEFETADGSKRRLSLATCWWLKT